jgi:hypothetical protein
MIVGRLTAEEFEERLGLAQRAITRADLDGVRSDLPINPMVLPPSVSDGGAPGSAHA